MTEVDYLGGNRSAQSSGLRGLLASYLPDGVTTNTAWRVWIELWAAALGSPELQALNDTVYDSWRKIVREAVAAARDSGALSDSPATGDPLENLRYSTVQLARCCPRAPS